MPPPISCSNLFPIDLSCADVDQDISKLVFANPNEQCRFCLEAKPNMSDMTHMEMLESGFADMYTEVTSLSVDIGAAESSSICPKCKSDIEEAFKIRKKFRRVDTLWRIYVASMAKAHYFNANSVQPDENETFEEASQQREEIYREGGKIEGIQFENGDSYDVDQQDFMFGMEHNDENDLESGSDIHSGCDLNEAFSITWL